MIDSNKRLKRFFDNEFQKFRIAKKVVAETSAYFGEIGSTQTEDIFYEDQLQIKSLAIREIFSAKLPEQTRPILEDYKMIASPSQFEYRFRMDFVCSYNPFHEPNSRMGQRKRKRFNHVVDMTSCNLIPAEIFWKVRSIYDYAKTLQLRDYDLVKHDGELRYLVVKGVDPKNLMINVITKSKDCEEQIKKLAEFANNLSVKSFNWIVEPGISDKSEGEVFRYYLEKSINVILKSDLGSKTLMVGANTFFQNNINCFEKILSYIHNYISSIPETRKEYVLYDLYSGVGTFGICLADKFKEVISIELNAESVELARENAELNKITNIKHYANDLNDIDTNILETKLKKFLIVDPPRTGLQKTGIMHITSLDPDIIIYVSCNPITQMQDLNLLQENFELVAMRGFDMFPNTYHMENVMVLERK